MKPSAPGANAGASSPWRDRTRGPKKGHIPQPTARTPSTGSPRPTHAAPSRQRGDPNPAARPKSRPRHPRRVRSTRLDTAPTTTKGRRREPHTNPTRRGAPNRVPRPDAAPPLPNTHWRRRSRPAHDLPRRRTRRQPLAAARSRRPERRRPNVAASFQTNHLLRSLVLDRSHFRERVPALLSAGPKPASTHQSPNVPPPIPIGAALSFTPLPSPPATIPTRTPRCGPRRPPPVASLCAATRFRPLLMQNEPAHRLHRELAPPARGRVHRAENDHRESGHGTTDPSLHSLLRAIPHAQAPTYPQPRTAHAGAGRTRPSPPFSRTDREEKPPRCRFVQCPETSGHHGDSKKLRPPPYGPAVSTRGPTALGHYAEPGPRHYAVARTPKLPQEGTSPAAPASSRHKKHLHKTIQCCVRPPKRPPPATNRHTCTTPRPP